VSGTKRRLPQAGRLANALQAGQRSIKQYMTQAGMVLGITQQRADKHAGQHETLESTATALAARDQPPAAAAPALMPNGVVPEQPAAMHVAKRKPRQHATA
jgi:hypothetical protein